MTTAATATNLTSATRVKEALGITDTSQDAFISALIPRVSEEVVSYLRIPDADDGARATLGRETYVETIKQSVGDYALYLTRRPISSITSVVEDGAALVDGTDFQTNKRLGVIERLSGDDIIAWSFEKLVVTYVAGYLLPDDGSRNLPYDIEEAAIYAIGARLTDLQPESCDREVKSETFPGVYSATYETSGAKAHDRGGVFPDRSLALLARHRMPMI